MRDKGTLRQVVVNGSPSLEPKLPTKLSLVIEVSVFNIQGHGRVYPKLNVTLVLVKMESP